MTRKTTATPRLPGAYRRLQERNPAVTQAHDRLGEACANAGPLTERERALVKLALSTGARLEGGVHAHTRKGLAVGVSLEDLRHVALLGITTIGFPASVAALTWIEETAAETKSGRS